MAAVLFTNLLIIFHNVLIMKNLALYLVLILFLSFAVSAQTSVVLKFEYEKECGSPFEESKLFNTREGRIIKILSGSRVLFEQRVVNGNTEKGTFTVRLAGIDPQVNKENLKKFLRENILHKQIDVRGGSLGSSDKKFPGILWGAGFADVNKYMLENGLAEYSKDSSYSIPLYVNCVYRLVAEKAKREGVGIWAK